jgi:hypothetical protein
VDTARDPVLERNRIHRGPLDEIERVFAKMKTLLRRDAVRTREGLEDRVGHLPDRFEPDECARHLDHCGCVGSE